MTDSQKQNNITSLAGGKAIGLLTKLRESSQHEEVQQTLQKSASLDSWAADTQSIVTNIVKAANSLQGISNQTTIDIQARLASDFKQQFTSRVDDLKQIVNNRRQEIETFTIYETQLNNNRSLHVNLDKNIKIFDPEDLKGLKLTDAGAIIAEDINERGEAKNVLSVQIKEGEKETQLGYATDSAIYAPDKKGGFFIASTRNLGKSVSLNATAQSGYADSALTAVRIKREDSPLTQNYTGGIIDSKSVLDASLQYKSGRDLVNASLGSMEKNTAVKASYEHQFNDSCQFNCHILAAKETAQLKFEYIEKQSDSMHKLSMLLNNRSAQLAYNYESKDNWFVNGSAAYDDTQTHRLTATMRTGYSRDF